VKASELREMQAPLKERYRVAPEAALVTLRAQGRLAAESLTCKVETGRALVEAGLHPATGGNGLSACSGDMLLEALVACAGVTLRAVATALDIELRGGTVSAEGDLDFRGTLGVSREAPVGFRDIRLRFDLDTDAPADKVDSLVKLAERYCVVYQAAAGQSRRIRARSFRQSDCRAVIEIAADDLDTDRQTALADADRCHRGRQTGQGRNPDPCLLVAVGNPLVVDVELALQPRPAIVREGQDRHQGAQHDVDVPKQSLPTRAEPAADAAFVYPVAMAVVALQLRRGQSI